MATVFDSRHCQLGEGPLWHPLRQQFFWFDIVGKRLLSQRDGQPLLWQFDEHVSAAGWVDHDTLLIASETGLLRFDINSGRHQRIVELEADETRTRSNDGRADLCGGFWIGTMDKQSRAQAGAIYRFYQGELRQLYSGVSIPNSICFSQHYAYFCDTPRHQIMRQTLDHEGWPVGEPTVFIETGGLNADGSVIDAEGALWNAQWGASRVARYLPNGELDQCVAVAARHASCPAFGAEGLRTLLVTSAREGIEQPDDDQGRVYAQEGAGVGVAEPRVQLG